tara:strand:- start:497 stop:1921 length:1425 start_codon:yes stop_codon:yes gene_type:complete
MIKIFYDRIIDGERVPNGIPEEWVKFYSPQFNPVEFRKEVGFDAAVYPSDLYQHNGAELKLVSEIKNNEQTDCLGIYPIEGFASPDRSIGNDPFWNKKYKSAFDYMSDEAKKYLKNNTLRLYYGFLQEAFIKDSELKKLHYQLKTYGIKNAIVAVNDYLAPQRYDNWISKNNKTKRFNVIVFSHSLFEKSHEIYCILNNLDTGIFDLSKPYEKHKHSAMSVDDFESTINIKRKSNLLCLNRRMRPHRLATLCILNRNNLIDNNDISFQFTFDDCPYYVSDHNHKIFDEVKRDYYEKDFHELKKKKFKYVDYPIAMDAKDGIHHGYGWENCKPYLNTYLSIVTETDFTNPTGYVSEKTWKPISFFHPFILVGNSKSLNFIKTFGFKTFSPFIDESYDLETDNIKRFDMIEREIIRIGKMSIDEIHEWYWSMKDILIYNYELFLEYAVHHSEYNLEFLNILTSQKSDIVFLPKFRK